jgi:hypothetical protein
MSTVLCFPSKLDTAAASPIVRPRPPLHDVIGSSMRRFNQRLIRQTGTLRVDWVYCMYSGYDVVSLPLEYCTTRSEKEVCKVTTNFNLEAIDNNYFCKEIRIIPSSISTVVIFFVIDQRLTLTDHAHPEITQSRFSQTQSNPVRTVQYVLFYFSLLQ